MNIEAGESKYGALLKEIRDEESSMEIDENQTGTEEEPEEKVEEQMPTDEYSDELDEEHEKEIDSNSQEEKL